MAETLDKRSDWWKYAVGPLREAIAFAKERKAEAGKSKRSPRKENVR